LLSTCVLCVNNPRVILILHGYWVPFIILLSQIHCFLHKYLLLDSSYHAVTLLSFCFLDSCCHAVTLLSLCFLDSCYHAVTLLSLCFLDSCCHAVTLLSLCFFDSCCHAAIFDMPLWTVALMSFPYRILLLSGACEVKVKLAVPTLFRFILGVLREPHVSYIKTFFSHLLGVT
jgi:hypothetical protein